MATLRDIKRRIKSVQSTKQITKAMEMVAAAKLRKATQRAVEARPYANGMIAVLNSLSSSAVAQAHPLFQKREVKRKALILVASDRGLCGGYNSNILRALDLYLKAQTVPVALYLVGRKSVEYNVRRKREIVARFTDLPTGGDFATAQDIVRQALDDFLAGRVDQVDIIYTHFISTANRKVVSEGFLPISGEKLAAGETQKSRDFILEPNPEAIFDALLPRYCNTRIYVALAEASASEQSARMIAMGSANKNAGEMINTLTLTRNRLRQAAITKELAEIVGGADALA
jgi:F-type H+-transporting ATPase subunit gamma